MTTSLTTKQRRQILAAVGRGYLIVGQSSATADVLSTAWHELCRAYRWPWIRLTRRPKTTCLDITMEHVEWPLRPGQAAVADWLVDTSLEASWSARPRRNAYGGGGGGGGRWFIAQAAGPAVDEALRGFLDLLREAELAHNPELGLDPLRWWLTAQGWPIAVALRHYLPTTRGGCPTVDVLCPLCGAVHTHGDAPGHRVAHCRGDFEPGGYIIAEVPDRLVHVPLPVEYQVSAD